MLLMAWFTRIKHPIFVFDTVEQLLSGTYIYAYEWPLQGNSPLVDKLENAKLAGNPLQSKNNNL